MRHLTNCSVLLILLLFSASWADPDTKPFPYQKYQSEYQEAQKLLGQGTSEGYKEAISKFSALDAELIEWERRFKEFPDSPEKADAVNLVNSFRMNTIVGMSMALQRKGQSRKAIEVLQSFLPSAEAARNILGQGMVLKGIAENQVNLGELKAAQSNFQKAIEIYSADSIKFSEAIRYARLSYFFCLKQLNDTKEAKRQLKLIEDTSLKLADSGKRELALLQLYNIRGNYLLAQSEYENAQHDFEALLKLQRVESSPSDKLGALLSLSTLQVAMGNLPEQERIFDRAALVVREAEEAGIELQPFDLTVFYLGRVALRSTQGKHALALEDVDRVDHIHQTLGGEGLSPAFTFRLDIYEAQNRLGLLLPELRVYFSSLAEPSLDDLELKLRYADALAITGKPEVALSILGELIPELERMEANRVLSRAFQLQGKIYHQYQVLDKANYAFQKAIDLARSSQNQNAVFTMRTDLLNMKILKPVYARDYAAISHEYRELSQELSDGKHNSELAVLASAYLKHLKESKRHEEAEQVLETLSGLGDTIGGDFPILATIAKSQLARARVAKEEGPEFLRELRQILASPQGKNQKLNVASEIVMWVQLLDGKLLEEPATQHFLGKPPEFGSLNELLWYLDRKAETHRALEQPDLEFEALEQQETVISSIRQNSPEDEALKTLSLRANMVYSDAILWLKAKGHPEEAFLLADRAQGSSISNILGSKSGRELGNLTTEQRKEIDALFARREALEKKLLESDGEANQQTYDDLRQTLFEIDSFFKVGGQSLGLFEPGLRSQNLSPLTQLQSHLGEKEVLLRFFVTSGGSYLFVVTRDDPVKILEVPEEAKLQKAVSEYRRAVIRKSSTGQKHAQVLGKMLFGELPDLGNYSRVFIVPDGPLYMVPFYEIPGPSKQPMMEHNFLLLASTHSLRAGKVEEQSVPAGSTVTMFANPKFGGVTGVSEGSDLNLGLSRAAASSFPKGFAPLPGTTQEAKIVQRLCGQSFNFQLFTDAAASLENLYKIQNDGSLAESRILHFATHGVAVAEDPKLSGLVLSLVDAQGNPKSGYLRMADLHALNLNTDLVVLSACETGQGTVQLDGGLESLYHGFLRAGSQQVLTTLWKIDDDATAKFMEHFYKKLLSGSTTQEALTEAQQSMRRSEEWKSPYYWAGFQLISR